MTLSTGEWGCTRGFPGKWEGLHKTREKLDFLHFTNIIDKSNSDFQISRKSTCTLIVIDDFPLPSFIPQSCSVRWFIIQNHLGSITSLLQLLRKKGIPLKSLWRTITFNLQATKYAGCFSFYVLWTLPTLIRKKEKIVKSPLSTYILNLPSLLPVLWLTTTSIFSSLKALNPLKGKSQTWRVVAETECFIDYAP